MRVVKRPGVIEVLLPEEYGWNTVLPILRWLKDDIYRHFKLEEVSVQLVYSPNEMGKLLRVIPTRASNLDDPRLVRKGDWRKWRLK